MNDRLLWFSCGLYRRLLLAYPATFRREYEGEMQQVFQEACRNELKSGGTGGLLRFWAGILGDLVVSACKERTAVMDKKAALFCLLAFAIGLFIGYLDFHSTEVQAPVLMILLFTFGFGFASPRRTWRWALLIGIGVPLCHIINALLHRPPPYPVEPNVLATCLAFIPAFLGAYTGAMLRNFSAWASAS